MLAVALAAAIALAAFTREDGPARYDLDDDLTAPQAVAQIAARHTHGYNADQLPPDQLDVIAAERPIVSTCGYVSAWAVQVLEREGIEARVVQTLTLDEWDGFNDGHTMIEARMDGRWVLFDVDRDVWFWRDGAPLSLIGLVDVVGSGGYEVRPLSGDPIDAAAIRVDDRRLMQVPIMHDGDERRFFSTDPARVEAYSDAFQRMNEDAWRVRFYS